MPLTYKQAAKIAKELNFSIIRQTGSHKQYSNGKGVITIPFHKEYAIGTAKNIIKQLAKLSNIEEQKLIQDYKIKF